MYQITDLADSNGVKYDPEQCPVPFSLVIGDPIVHSWSPLLHQTAYGSLGLPNAYGRAQVSQSELSDFIQQLPPKCLGLSVTMPHKQEIIKYLDQVDGLAKAVGAVNTVLTAPGGIKAGFNTDVYGIVQAVREIRGRDFRPEQMVIVGSGATASSALAAAGELKPKQITVLARRMSGPSNVMIAGTRLGITPQFVPLARPDLAIEKLNQADLIISTVPKLVLDDLYQQLTVRAEQSVLDVVYDPWPSTLVQKFDEAAATVIPGWLMLLHQAVLQVKLFTSRTAQVSIMKEALETALINK